MLNFFRRLKARWRYNQCHNLATKIAGLGYDNGDAQRNLDKAKDHLYYAGNIFKAESESEREK
jgi:hypothetical protein